ncbi:Uncharacterised protein [Mycobacterium tuberculosis]|nr:Uncharacterised protein [Mycobacterium tuberculosis]
MSLSQTIIPCLKPCQMLMLLSILNIQMRIILLNIWLVVELLSSWLVPC